MCNISVHQKCYGINELPSGDWICQVCTAFGAKQGKLLRCPLCSIRGGAMKPTDTPFDSPLFNSKSAAVSGKRLAHSAKPETSQQQPTETGKPTSATKEEPREEPSLVYDFKQDFTEEELAHEPRPQEAWVHLSCAYWIPELEFSTEAASETITGLDAIDGKRFKLVCSICRLRGVGCCLQCGKGKCQTAFHAECARLAGLYMEFSNFKEEGTSNIVYCEKHRPLKLRKAIEQTHKRSEEDVVGFCRLIDKCRGRDEKFESAVEEGRPRKVLSNKFFNKIEKKQLMNRIRHVCKKLAKLTVLLGRQRAANATEAPRFRILPNPYKIQYKDTLAKRYLPWNDIKFARFTAENCYHKYVSLVPDEETFKRKILQLGKKQIELEAKIQQKVIEQVKAQIYPPVPVDPTKYCYCHKTTAESPPGQMIGTVVPCVISRRMLRRPSVSRQWLVPRGLCRSQAGLRGARNSGLLLRPLQGPHRAGTAESQGAGEGFVAAVASAGAKGVIIIRGRRRLLYTREFTLMHSNSHIIMCNDSSLYSL